MKWQVQLRLARGDGFEGGAKAEDEGGVIAEAVGGGRHQTSWRGGHVLSERDAESG